MKKMIIALALGVCVLPLCYAGPLDWFGGIMKSVSSRKLSETKIGSGLKEALKVGIENAVKLLGKTDGYFNNELVKICLPENMQKIEPALRKLGFGEKIDSFILSMNRAAELAAPGAADIFSTAIADLSFDDVQKIYQGGNTAATEYLKKTTSVKLREQFLPVVRQRMDEQAVVKRCGELLVKAQKLPLLGKYASAFDVNEYVTTRALDGLFKVLAREETKIRTDPQARVTELLKEVFK